ncbi:3-hydroxyacyl-CoA dehydrogenase NAD-binding domain-containing protein [Burkholderia orbicola]|uniref:3-hydroxyacyl-CoA dehydrogenase NAD-binding domain-containing protein n=1 Tax=Burkholderia orbicola TaxID=2978683 RepID=UPI0035C75779
MGTEIRTESIDDVLVIYIDNPPVNAGSRRVRSGILDAIQQLSLTPAFKAGVLIGAGGTFVSGSDLREFGLPLEAPELPAVIAAIEACPKPVVAALHGAALGGGFELALGCDARVASKTLVVGLPEVTLGMIPGAGGTQRLPRLVGVAEAIRLICSGERVSAERALALGIIDGIVEDDLLGNAVRYAIDFGKKRRLRDLIVPTSSATAVALAEESAMRKGKGRPQVEAAINAVKAALTLPVDEALANERAVFTELRMSADAFALRHIFFAEREAFKVPELQYVAAANVGIVAVVGAGTMGAGIAIAALDAEYRVLLFDNDSTALSRGRDRILAHYQNQVAKGNLPEGEMEGRIAMLTTSADWSCLRSADLVIEAVFEDMVVKQAAIQLIDRFTKPDVVIATNTSYLDLDAIALATSRPSAVIGLHFFSPANVMKLVEVVRGRESSARAIATGIGVARRLRKIPVLSRNAFGFIGNRIYAAYRYQCELMLEDGAYPEQIDTALEAFGFAMGPFSVADMSGLDIAWRMRQARANMRNPEARYVEVPDRLCELGRLGRKTGSGYYRYDEGGRGKSDPTVHRLIDDARAKKGMVAQSLSVADIQMRALLAMVNEAALLFAESVASRPADIDVVMVNGYGFPRWQGGPLYWARRQGRAPLEQGMEVLRRVTGPGFNAGDLSVFLEDGPQ